MIFLSSISQKLISILPNKWKSLKITREILVLKECRDNLIFLYISVFVMTKKKSHLPEAWILNKMEFSGSGKERDIRVQTAHNEKMMVISGNKRTNTSLDWTGSFIQCSCRRNRYLRSRKKYTNRKKPTGISSYHILVTRMWVQQIQNQPQILSGSWFSTAWQCGQLQSEECRLVFVFHWLKIFRISVLLHVTFPAPIL